MLARWRRWLAERVVVCVCHRIACWAIQGLLPTCKPIVLLCRCVSVSHRAPSSAHCMPLCKAHAVLLCTLSKAPSAAWLAANTSKYRVHCQAHALLLCTLSKAPSTVPTIMSFCSPDQCQSRVVTCIQATCHMNQSVIQKLPYVSSKRVSQLTKAKAQKLI